MENHVDSVHTKKSISLLSACSIIVGTIVGSGIFITAKSILENSGSPGLSLIIWVLSGFIAFIGAICYTELGTLIQESGGDYSYISKAYGHLLAFLYIWMMVFICLPSLNAASATTIAKYLIQMFFANCEAPLLAEKLISAMIICLLGFLNTFNVKSVSKIQTVFTILKVIVIAIVIGAGFWQFINSTLKSKDMVTSWFTLNKQLDFSSITLALYSSMYAYSGW